MLLSLARAQRQALAALIVIALSGCDNVDWGGIELAVVPPPPTSQAQREAAAEAPADERMPDGPVLYYVHISQGGVPVLTPVAEVSGDSLRELGGATSDRELWSARFIAAHLRQGAEFTLFRRGLRAGTLVIRDAGMPDSNACPLLPRAAGVLELVADTALRSNEYLAMAKAKAPDSRMQPPPGVNRGMQIVAPILAERMMRARGAQLPGNWQRAMAQLQAFPLADYPDPGFAATFLVGDELRTAPTSSTVAYSLFFIGMPKTQLGYDTAYVAFHDYARGSKAAPRVIDYLDWDRDGQAELLLQTFGATNAWFEAIGNRGERWTHIYRGSCPAASQPATAAAAPASVDTPAAARTQPSQTRETRPRVLGTPAAPSRPPADTSRPRP